MRGDVGAEAPPRLKPFAINLYSPPGACRRNGANRAGESSSPPAPACRAELRAVKGFLSDLGFSVLPRSAAIGHRAAVYVEKYGLGTALVVADALIAATAAEHALTLCTGNRRQYAAIKDLALKGFQP